MRLIELALTGALSAVSLATTAGVPMEAFLNKVIQGGYSVELIVDCGISPEINQNEIILFGADTNRLSDWSHANKIEGLSLNSVQYRGEVVADASCNNATTYQNVLVKKYANWHAQHVNGIVPKFSSDDIKLSELESIVLELKFSADGSSIPTKMDILNLYNAFLNEDQLKELDDNKINLGITIFEVGFNDQTTASLHANVFLELEQAHYYDQWIRIKIPVSNLNYFTVKGRSKTPINREDFADTTIVGLRINPETQSGNVVRHFIFDIFETNTPPEAYKEMNVSFKKIALVLKLPSQRHK